MSSEPMFNFIAFVLAILAIWGLKTCDEYQHRKQRDNCKSGHTTLVCSDGSKPQPRFMCDERNAEKVP